MDNQYRSVLVNQWLGKINFFYWNIIALLTNCLPILWPRANSLERLMPGKDWRQKEKGQQRMRCLDSITDSVDMLLFFSGSAVSNSLWPHGLQHARLPCPSPTPRVHSNSCPLNWWCHPTISSSVIPFSSCLQSSQHQGLFKWVSSSHQVAKLFEFLLHGTMKWWSTLQLGNKINTLIKG